MVLQNTDTRSIQKHRRLSFRAVAHLHVVEDFEEGEGHASSDDHLVDLVQHVVDQLDLIFDLCSGTTVGNIRHKIKDAENGGLLEQAPREEILHVKDLC